jgi:hypothetical protein
MHGNFYEKIQQKKVHDFIKKIPCNLLVYMNPKINSLIQTKSGGMKLGENIVVQDFTIANLDYQPLRMLVVASTIW